jgi:hypothetical protein
MIINLTPHVVHIEDRDFEPSGTIARCAEVTGYGGTFDGVMLVTKSFGEVENLPDPVNGVMYIVSMLVRSACPDRHDLASPGDLVRDDKGNIVGCKNLAVNK